MKKYLYTTLFFGLILCTGCEEVVELDLDQHDKKVVIDANLFVGENDYNKIKVFYSSPFYADGYQYITTATVTITDLVSSQVYPFSYTTNGNYENAAFIPNLTHEYQLNINYNGNEYKAVSKVTQAPKIEEVEQINDAGFTGNSYEIRFYYQDDPNTDDYYLSQVKINDENEFSISNDQFTNGNRINDLYFADEDQLGKTFYYALAKVDKDYYNYLNKLFSNAATAGNPFATPTGTVKGNITNTTNASNYPLGYFHIAKRESATHTIK